MEAGGQVHGSPTGCRHTEILRACRWYGRPTGCVGGRPMEDGQLRYEDPWTDGVFMRE